MTKKPLRGLGWAAGTPEEMDEQFRTFISAQPIIVMEGLCFRRLRKRGWKSGARGWERNGVLLSSTEGLAEDREDFALLNDNEKRVALSVVARDADDKLLRALRIAYEAGCARKEYQAYLEAIRGRGRPKGSETKKLFEELDNAEARWRKKTPDLSRRPTAKNLSQHAMNIPASGKTFANLVSMWRADRSRK